MSNNLKLPNFFCPLEETELSRVGKENDGGYLIPKKSINQTKILYSFGLSDDWSFESEFYNKIKPGMNCILTPHISGVTIESNIRVSDFIVKKITDFFN